MHVNTWQYMSGHVFGVSGLVFGCLDLYFGCLDLYLGVWSCISGVWNCISGVWTCISGVYGRPGKQNVSIKKQHPIYPKTLQIASPTEMTISQEPH